MNSLQHVKSNHTHNVQWKSGDWGLDTTCEFYFNQFHSNWNHRQQETTPWPQSQGLRVMRNNILNPGAKAGGSGSAATGGVYLLYLCGYKCAGSVGLSSPKRRQLQHCLDESGLARIRRRKNQLNSYINRTHVFIRSQHTSEMLPSKCSALVGGWLQTYATLSYLCLKVWSATLTLECMHTSTHVKQVSNEKRYCREITWDACDDNPCEVYRVVRGYLCLCSDDVVLCGGQWRVKKINTYWPQWVVCKVVRGKGKGMRTETFAIWSSTYF